MSSNPAILLPGRDRSQALPLIRTKRSHFVNSLLFLGLLSEVIQFRFSLKFVQSLITKWRILSKIIVLVSLLGLLTEVLFYMIRYIKRWIIILAYSKYMFKEWGIVNNNSKQKTADKFLNLVSVSHTCLNISPEECF